MSFQELQQLIKVVNETLFERHPNLNICVGDRDQYGWKIHLTNSDQQMDTMQGWVVEVSTTSGTPWQIQQYGWRQNWGGYEYLAQEAVEIYNSLLK